MHQKNKIVFDASAAFALLKQERGSEIVETYLDSAIISSVNLCEVISTLSLKDISLENIHKILKNLIPEVIDFNEEQAYIAGSLRKTTKDHDLSQGDRAALSLALLYQIPVLTADQIWSQIDCGVNVILIR